MKIRLFFIFCSRNTNNHIENIGNKARIIDFPVNVAVRDLKIFIAEADRFFRREHIHQTAAEIARQLKKRVARNPNGFLLHQNSGADLRVRLKTVFGEKDKIGEAKSFQNLITEIHSSVNEI